jgi:hypothetical protein
MKRKMLLSLAVVVMGAAFSGMALAEDSIVKIQSQHSFDQTVSQVQTATGQNGMMVMAHLNQGQVLAITGLQLKAESFLVGNPNLPRQERRARPTSYFRSFCPSGRFMQTPVENFGWTRGSDGLP